MSAPPGFGKQYAQEQRQAQQLDQRMVETDLNRRASMLGNIISNAPNIAALSGIGAVDKLIGQYPEGEGAFATDYGLEGDKLRRMEQMARLAAIGRQGTGKAAKGTTQKPGQWYRIDYGKDAGGVQDVFVPYNETDSLPYHLQIQIGQNKAIPIANPNIDGVNVRQPNVQPQPSANATVATPDTAGGGGNIVRTDPDGTMHFKDGSVLRPDGTVE
jgi:hypothetical protein